MPQAAAASRQETGAALGMTQAGSLERRSHNRTALPLAGALLRLEASAARHDYLCAAAAAAQSCWPKQERRAAESAKATAKAKSRRRGGRRRANLIRVSGG